MKKVMIVDDSPFIRSVLRGIVEKFCKDIHVSEADCGTVALKELKRVLPDLLLLDIIMAEDETDGLHVLGRVQGVSPITRVIMVTAVGHEAMIERCRELGVEDYIIKPFDDHQIEQLLQKYLGTK